MKPHNKTQQNGKEAFNKNWHTFIASQYENQEAILTGKQTIKEEGKAPDIFQFFGCTTQNWHWLVYLHSL